MEHIWSYALFVTLAVVAAPAALASGDYGKYLPPDQAFQLSSRSTPQAAVLSWQIADGYYLYKKKFHIVATHGKVGKPKLPSGISMNDENFGHVRIYKHRVRINVPYKKIPDNGKLALKVTYQGCAQDALCYPPITKTLTIPVPHDAATVGG